MNRPDIERIKATLKEALGYNRGGPDELIFYSAQSADAADEFIADGKDLLAYIAALEAALPKTGDKVPEVIVPGMRVWAHVSTDEDSWYTPGMVRSIDLVGGKFELLVICDDGWDLEDFAPCNVFAFHPETGERA